VNAWETPDFKAVLKAEIEQLGPDELPLQQGLSTASYATDAGVEAMIISAAREEGVIRAKAGIFYKGIIAGCSCADDPTPVEEQSEYCEMQFEIDPVSGEARVNCVVD